MAVVIEGLLIWILKCHQNNSPVAYDGYVKYEEADADRLVVIWKQITAAAADNVVYINQPTSSRAA